MHTRYAIRLNADTENPSWNCQGLPKDMNDFGFAILYASVEHAKKALKKNPAWAARCNAQIVEVQCFVGSLVDK